MTKRIFAQLRGLFLRGGLALVLSLSLCAASAPAARALGPEDLHYVIEIYPPFNYLDEQGRPIGLYVDVLRLMWDEMGVSPQPIEVLPWARAMYLLETRDDVVLFGAAWTAERAVRLKYVYPIKTTRYVVAGLSRAHNRIRGVSEITGNRKVGVVRGDASEQMALERGIPEEALERLATMDDLLNMVLRGRFDFFVVDDGAMASLAGRHGLAPEDLSILIVLKEAPEGFLLSAKVPDNLVARMQRALDAVKALPEFPELLRRYGQ